LYALAYIMWLAWINPWEKVIDEEKNLEAWAQKKAVEQKEEVSKGKESQSEINPIFWKIKQLVTKNDEIWQEKIAKQLQQAKYIRNLEENKPVNNIFNTPNEILSEKDEAA
jgi:hypothetical protein